MLSASRRTDEVGAGDEDGAEGGDGTETAAKSILDTYGIHSCPIFDLTGKTPLGLLDEGVLPGGSKIGDEPVGGSRGSRRGGDPDGTVVDEVN